MLVYHAAWLKDQGKPNQYETSVGKLAASEAAVHAANECMKIFGSYGFSSEYPAERFYRDAQITADCRGYFQYSEDDYFGYCLWVYQKPLSRISFWPGGVTHRRIVALPACV